MGGLRTVGVCLLAGGLGLAGGQARASDDDAPKEETMKHADALPRKVIVGTSMYAMYGSQRKYPGLEARLGELAEIVGEMARKAGEAYPGQGLDLAVLPEFAVNGGKPGTPAEIAFPLEGPVLDAMGATARKHRTYIVVPLYLTEPGEGAYTNACALLDRQGKVAGIYRKVHPVAALGAEVLEGGVKPGTEFPVFACDFGKVGIQICFDVNFEDGWEALARQGADIVAWPTQSPQTVLPSVYALRHGLHIVSSTWRNNASLFDPTGLIVKQIREPERVMVQEVDLTYVLLPWQPALANGKAVKEKYGDRVGYRYSEAEDGGIFWSNDASLPIRQVVREMGLEEERELIERNLNLQKKIRGKR